MNENPTITAIEIPLHILLRRRRQELKLVQSKVAEALHVSPECVTLWEAGRRRMDLSKLPRIALVLQLDPPNTVRSSVGGVPSSLLCDPVGQLHRCPGEHPASAGLSRSHANSAIRPGS